MRSKAGNSTPPAIADLVAALAVYAGPAGAELVQKAYLHSGRCIQASNGGHSKTAAYAQLNQALAAAEILVELGAKAESVAAALLANLPRELCPAEVIQEHIGEAVAQLVDDVLRMRQIPYLSTANRLAWSEKQRADLYRAFVAALDSPHPILIELAFQLNKLRNLSTFFSTEQRRIVSDAMEIYAPLASRLGIWRIKWEMEDRAFSFINPEQFHKIAENLNERRESREQDVKEVAAKLEAELAQHGIQARISGRPKHIYSIYRKMQRKGVPLEAIYDVRALRVIVDDKETCYLALGIVHELWTPIPGQYDDYITSKKSNGYQSLHTAVIGDDDQTIEIQIRTQQMHDDAERGFAAHWRYKEQGSKQATRRKKSLEAEQAVAQKISWLRSLLQDPDGVETKTPAVEPVEEPVFVFTPMGDVIRLPPGSTPIDLAYRIHTELGHRCYAAKVNDRIVPLDHQLQSGDRVEIITKKRGGPNINWLSKESGFIKTREARKKIAAWFRSQQRAKNITRGHEILERELGKQGLKSIRSFDEVARLLNLASADELLVQIGSGMISPEKVRLAVAAQPKITKEDRAREADEELVTDAEEAVLLIDRADDGKIPADVQQGMVIASTAGLHSRLARCCNPVPRETIVGYVTRGHGATIHLADCPNILSAQDAERIVPAAWGSIGGPFPVKVIVEALNRRGLMADIGQTVSKEKVDIAEARVQKQANWALFELQLEVTDAQQLQRVLEKLAGTKGVRTAYRKKG